MGNCVSSRESEIKNKLEENERFRFLMCMGGHQSDREPAAIQDWMREKNSRRRPTIGEAASYIAQHPDKYDDSGDLKVAPYLAVTGPR